MLGNLSKRSHNLLIHLRIVINYFFQFVEWNLWAYLVLIATCTYCKAYAWRAPAIGLEPTTL